jgi:ubiquinone/menaquinone biosynthesis C-methylase UbiE
MDLQKEQEHKAEIVDQFSRQAIPFTQVQGHLDAMEILPQFSGVGPEDRVLDVACGPGLVACAFARHAMEVTGMDITPAMIEQAKKHQLELGLENGDIGRDNIGIKARVLDEKVIYTVPIAVYLGRKVDSSP